MYHHLPELADELVKKRFQIVNVSSHGKIISPGETSELTYHSQVWRPIKTIFKDPLAVADAHSVPDTDLVGTALIYPDRRGETYSVKANPKHQW